MPLQTNLQTKQSITVETAQTNVTLTFSALQSFFSLSVFPAIVLMIAETHFIFLTGKGSVRHMEYVCISHGNDVEGWER